MERTIENCFYCQSLGGIPTKWGLCSFCGKKSRPVMVPLYEVYEAGKMKQFCCGARTTPFFIKGLIIIFLIILSLFLLKRMSRILASLFFL